jgi:Xaa-Pro aminopeptidase
MKRKLSPFILFFFLGLLYVSILHAQEDFLPKDYLSKEFHAGRRDALRKLMPANSVCVIFAYPTRTFSNDVDYVYHQNPDMYYFSGYKEPHSVFLIFKEPQTGPDGNRYDEILFAQERNPRREQWDGRRLGADGVKEKLGIKTVFNGKEFKNHAFNFSGFDKILMAPLPIDISDNRYEDADLLSLVSEFKTKLGSTLADTKKVDNALFQELTGRLREIKTAEELDLLRKAVEISCQGQNEVMKALQPGMSEMEIQGLHEYVHKKYGAEEVGYGSIIGAGANGCVLHYMENTKTRIGNEMLLMDVGAEYHGYTADVTRTVPANGKFSPEQKLIYNIVYDAQEAAFKTLKDGATWSDATTEARKTVGNGLLKLGIIRDVSEMPIYFPHGISHHIGLDVHDHGFSKTLKKDMVITIEPGIYIPPGSKCDKKWWGIAVRIEDDLLITQDGYELLSSFAPRKVEEIEKLMAQKSGLDGFILPKLKSGEKKPF